MGQIELKHKKVLVTGANGFLASHLIPALYQCGAKVYALDVSVGNPHPEINSYKVDLKDHNSLDEILDEIKPDIIYHLAASLNRIRDFSVVNDILDVNLNGTNNLLNAIKDIPYEKFIYVSTSEVYGGSLISSPFKEDDNFIPASPYALSKYCAEKSIQTFSDIYNRNYTILRLFNFFGKGMSNNFFIPQLVETLRANKDFDMTKGEQIRDFLYIKDVVKAMLLAQGAKANNSVLNVCYGKGKSIKDIALETKTVLNSESKIEFGAIKYRENEVWDMVGDNTKLKETLGWKPDYSYLEGLQDYLSETN